MTGWVALALSLCLLAGCNFPRWIVVDQAQPSPFRAQTRFYVEPISFQETLFFNTMPRKVFIRRPELSRGWVGAEPKASEALYDALYKFGRWRQLTFAPDPRPPDAYTIRVRCLNYNEHRTWSEHGSSTTYLMVFGVQILDSVDRSVVDEINIGTGSNRWLWNGDFGELKPAGAKLGEVLAGYLEERIVGRPK